MVSCDRCSGKGIIPVYYHIQNGMCFQCGGSGIMTLRQPIPHQQNYHTCVSIDELFAKQKEKEEAIYASTRATILAEMKRKKELRGLK